MEKYYDDEREDIIDGLNGNQRAIKRALAVGDHAAALTILATHIEGMIGDPYLDGHPEWVEIAAEATTILHPDVPLER